MAYTQRSYVESDSVKQWRQKMEDLIAQKPADYASKWQPQIDDTVNNILNRKDFQYDVNGDALYQQYKDRYTTLGQQAMMDTMGQAAKLTGGYGNSNAQMVGQQAYQNYLQGLTDKIPELYSLAYDRYNQQGQNMYNQYNLLNQQEQNDYNKWLQNYNLWSTERDYNTGRYDTERVYDYGVYRDSVSDDQWKAQFDEDLRRFQMQFNEDLRRFQMQWDDAHHSSSGGGGSDGGGSSSSRKRRKHGSGDVNVVYEAAKAAKDGGMSAASKYISDNAKSSAEKANATANAKGVSMTDYYKKRV